MIPGLRHRIYVSRDSIQFRPHLVRIGIKCKTGEPIDIATFNHLEQTKYDFAICLRRFIRTSSLILMSLINAQNRYCAWQYPTNISQPLASRLSNRWTHFSGDPRTLSELEYYKAFLTSFLSHRAWSNPTLTTPNHSKEDRRSGHVGLAIGGSSTNWPDSHWVELAKSLHDHGFTLSLFGGKDAYPLAKVITAELPQVESHIGNLSFSESTKKLEGLTLLIGNDTGFTHYACLFSPSCLIILGGGTFRRFFPWPESKNQYVIFNALECFDCTWNCHLERRECLHRITARSVATYAKSIMEGNAPLCLNLAGNDVEYKTVWKIGPNNIAMQRTLLAASLPTETAGAQPNN
jgi:ADP-heptose:LPS heptosyltransferase